MKRGQPEQKSSREDPSPNDPVLEVILTKSDGDMALVLFSLHDRAGRNLAPLTGSQLVWSRVRSAKMPLLNLLQRNEVATVLTPTTIQLQLLAAGTRYREDDERQATREFYSRVRDHLRRAWLSFEGDRRNGHLRGS